MPGAVPSLLQHAFMAWCSIKQWRYLVKHMENFNFTFLPQGKNHLRRTGVVEDNARVQSGLYWLRIIQQWAVVSTVLDLWVS
jgi:hypothetical protein